MTAAVDVPVVDGRRARRLRNRKAVIDSMLALLMEGRYPLAVEVIAERAGVSASSVFRYFDGLDDLLDQTVDRYFERFAQLFDVPSIGVGAFDRRVAGLVGARLDLHETIAPLARMARARSLDTPSLAFRLAETRALLADQVRLHFDPELATLTSARADGLVAVVDSLVSFEAWDLLQGTHRRSRAQIRRAWIAALHALLG